MLKASDDYVQYFTLLRQCYQNKPFDAIFRAYNCPSNSSSNVVTRLFLVQLASEVFKKMNDSQKQWLVYEYDIFTKLRTFLRNQICQMNDFLDRYRVSDGNYTNKDWQHGYINYHITYRSVLLLVKVICRCEPCQLKKTTFNKWFFNQQKCNTMLQNSGLLKDLIDVLSTIDKNINRDKYYRCTHLSGIFDSCWFLVFSNKSMVNYLILNTNIIQGVFETMNDIGIIMRLCYSLHDDNPCPHGSGCIRDGYTTIILLLASCVRSLSGYICNKQWVKYFCETKEAIDYKVCQCIISSFENNIEHKCESFLYQLVMHHFKYFASDDHKNHFKNLYKYVLVDSSSSKDKKCLMDILIVHIPKKQFSKSIKCINRGNKKNDINDDDYDFTFLITPQSYSNLCLDTVDYDALGMNSQHTAKLRQLTEYSLTYIRYQKMTNILQAKYGLDGFAYRIDCFGVDIGYYGVIPLLLSHIYHTIDYDCTDITDVNDWSKSKWSSHDISIVCGDRNIVRFVRTSIWKFVQNINNVDEKYKIHKRDGLFWQAFALIMLGKYSFYYANSNLFLTIINNNKDKDYKQSVDKASCAIDKLQKYLIKYVVTPIEQGLKKLGHKFNLSQCNFEFLQEIYGILRFCSCICGDWKMFQKYQALSSVLIQNTALNYQKDLKRDLEKCLMCSINKIKHVKTVTHTRRQTRRALATINAVSRDLMLLNKEFRKIKFGRECEVYLEMECKSRLNHLNKQFDKWKKHVVDENSRNDKLFSKWKNILPLKCCNYCGKNNKRLRKCQRCKKMYYCDKLCQKKDWKLNRHWLCCTIN